jgi:hypothetical protein
MPMRVLWRLCFQRSTNCSQPGSRRAHRMDVLVAIDAAEINKEASATKLPNQNVSPTSPAGRDAPWKSSAGAEGHFGLYTYDSHTDAGQLVPKFPL